jgi:DNA sulfur modification protein DndD
MKLIRAKFSNFRLLKDLNLDFSINADRPLTVIRAANETGKTTCEWGLMWALYGSKEALPKNGDFSLFPNDLKSSGVKRIEVSVEVEFEVDQIRRVGSGGKDTEKAKYRLERSCMENASELSLNRRESESVRMFKITASGSDPVPDGEASKIIENALPNSLRDVYFTDGDSAMSFIEAAASTGVKRKRVSNAIEALLGLDILKTTVRHLDNVSSKFSQEIDDTDHAKELEVLNDRIASWSEDIEEWESKRQELESQEISGKRELKNIKTQIESALKLGDKSKLAEEQKNIEKQIERSNVNSGLEIRQLASLLVSDGLSKAYVKSAATLGKKLLNNLSQKKQLPKVNIPILEELLDRENCFCGADLSELSEIGKESRRKIKFSIEKSRSSDAIQEVATGLFFRVRSENFDETSKEWLNDYGSISNAYQNTLTTQRDLDQKYKSLKEDIANIDDSCLQELKEQEQSLEGQLSRLNSDLSKGATKISEALQKKKEAEEDRTKVERKVGKTDISAKKMNLSRETQKVFKNIIDKLKKDELRNVSHEMNRIFLEMIGSSPEDNDLTLITQAELTDEYDIVVRGPGGVIINPDQDLNGASRRAITLAFILALTKVSQVEAPNVIDTPLGMMSGFVKQSVLMQMLKEGSQVILFLTHDEIKGVEPILDRYAGTIFTLTNPAHYPRMLMNESNVEDSRLLRCSCDHRNVCDICERKDMEIS